MGGHPDGHRRPDRGGRGPARHGGVAESADGRGHIYPSHRQVRANDGIHGMGRNKYIDVQAPWVLKKTDTERMRTVLYVLMEVMRHVAILDQLGVPQEERTFGNLGKDEFKILLGREVGKPKAVFPRFEVPATVSA